MEVSIGYIGVRARVAELADALDLGSSVFDVWVRVPSRAQGRRPGRTGGVTPDKLAAMSALEIGQQAPDFTVQTTQGTLSLSDLLAASTRGVVVYFYPKASTPGCTKQACDFRDSLASLSGAGYRVIGVSADSMAALQRFADKQSLTFPLASDPDHEVLEAYGAWGEKKNYGRTYVGIIRSTVVVAPDGTVALAQYNVKATGHVSRLRKTLGID